jgi:hypothetical protein
VTRGIFLFLLCFFLFQKLYNDWHRRFAFQPNSASDPWIPFPKNVHARDMAKQSKMKIQGEIDLPKSDGHKLDYAIKYLKQERRRITTERDVANSNKDYDLANDMDWIVNGLNAAIELLEEKRAAS